MKKILVIRNPNETEDSYGSSLEVRDDSGKSILTSYKINTLKSKGHAGGKLSPVKCYAIYHKMYNYPAFVLFNAKAIYDNIKTWVDLTEDQRTFDSEIPNPTQHNENKMKLIDLHIGKNGSDAGSNGCLSYLPEEYTKFEIFKDNEIVEFELTEG